MNVGEKYVLRQNLADHASNRPLSTLAEANSLPSPILLPWISFSPSTDE